MSDEGHTIGIQIIPARPIEDVHERPTNPAHDAWARALCERMESLPPLLAMAHTLTAAMARPLPVCEAPNRP